MSGSALIAPEDVELNARERAQGQIDPPPGPGCRVVIELQLEGETDWTNIPGADVSLEARNGRAKPPTTWSGL